MNRAGSRQHQWREQRKQRKMKNESTKTTSTKAKPLSPERILAMIEHGVKPIMELF